MLSLPRILRRVQVLGHDVFTRAYSANLIIERGSSGPGTWDGHLYLLNVEGSSGAWACYSWPCATYPAKRALRSPTNPNGVGTLVLGQHRLSHELGLHKGRPALVQVAGTELPVLRDPDRDDVYEPELASVGSGYNIHDVETPEGLEGCIGMQLFHRRQLLERFKVLRKHGGELNRKVSLTLIAG